MTVVRCKSCKVDVISPNSYYVRSSRTQVTTAMEPRLLRPTYKYVSALTCLYISNWTLKRDTLSVGLFSVLVSARRSTKSLAPMRVDKLKHSFPLLNRPALDLGPCYKITHRTENLKHKPNGLFFQRGLTLNFCFLFFFFSVNFS